MNTVPNFLVITSVNFSFGFSRKLHLSNEENVLLVRVPLNLSLV